jgi:hypothetical protein
MIPIELAKAAKRKLLSVNNSCEICQKKFTSTKDTHLDHEHEEGFIRGILCSNCNTGIGLFHDDILLLKNAIIYLEKFQNKKERMNPIFGSDYHG